MNWDHRVFTIQQEVQCFVSWHGGWFGTFMCFGLPLIAIGCGIAAMVLA